MSEALKQEPVLLFDEERLVGMLVQTGDFPHPTDPPPEALDLFDYTKQHLTEHGRVGLPGHITWNWRKILQLGISGLLREISNRMESTQDPKSQEFYRSAIIAWNGVLDWNRAHLAALQKRRTAAPPKDHARLDELIRIVGKVPYDPAETYHEALQSFYMQHLAIMFENPFGGNGPGRMDQILGPYLERDLAAGRITREEARFLIDELFLRFEERLAGNDGWVESVMVGGMNPDGSSCLNELSYILIESFMDLEQTHPAVYPRLCLEDPPEYWRLCIDYLIRGNNRAQLYNEEAMLAAITAAGVPFTDAVDYAAGGCMEPGIQGKCGDLNFATTCNIAKISEEVLFAENTLKCSNFPMLYSAFLNQVRKAFQQLSEEIDVTGQCMGEYRPTALLSSLLEDCLERGRDQHEGGVRYYDYGFAPLGIPAAADSWWAIKLAVYEQKLISLPELIAALKNNFASHETLRQQLRNLPKFGQGDQNADQFCGQVMKDVCDLAKATTNRYGGRMNPMIFNFVWTPEASSILAARGDGSFAGDYISHGMTPQSFAMRNGLTTALTSCASLGFSSVPGGATTMWDFDSQCAVPELLEPLIRVFFQRGGMIFQGNTTDVKVLEAALKKPEDHPQLVVRVGGFSAHFCSLNPELRQEITRRYRHSITQE